MTIKRQKALRAKETLRGGVGAVREPPLLRGIAVLTGGGDAPGLNAVIRSVTRTAILQEGWQVLGIRHGFEGLLGGDEGIMPLDWDRVSGLLSRGGTILGAASHSKKLLFTKNEEGEVVVSDEAKERIRERMEELQIDALVIIGGDGAESLLGDAGADIMIGGAGDDELSGQRGDDAINGGLGGDVLSGGQGADTLSGDGGADVLDGGAGADRLIGGRGADVLNGGNGKDFLHGGAGADRLEGGRGADALFGGAGRDVLEGGKGGDILVGGAGADSFVFDGVTGRDRITDFQDGADMLVFADAAGLQDLRIVDHADGARIAHDGGVVILEGVAADALNADDFLF